MIAYVQGHELNMVFFFPFQGEAGKPGKSGERGPSGPQVRPLLCLF